MHTPAGKPDPSPPRTIPVALERIARIGARAAREVPGAVALGGTVCAMYARHRLSIDMDFVLGDMRDRFSAIREHMLEVPGWVEASARPPVLLLGSLDGVQIGFRQLRRNTPIETATITTPDGPLVIPTLAELTRTKAYLLYARNAARDFVDFAALSMLAPDADIVGWLAEIDERFAWEKQPSILLGVNKALLHADPADLDEHGFDSFRWLEPRLTSWEQVRDRCRAIGALLTTRVAGGKSGTRGPEAAS